MRDRSNFEAGARARWLVGLQRALGIGPLSAYAAFHLWLNWPALSGREHWLARVREHGLGLWLGLLVLLVFALHAVLGVMRTAPGRAASDPGRSSSRFQALTGVLLLIFLLYHVPQVWPPASGAHAALTASYEQLWLGLGTPLALGTYVVGCAALAFHLAHGWAATLEIRVPGVLRSATRYAAGLTGFALFFLYLQLVGWFALGEAVVPLPQPPAAELPR